MGTSQLLSDPLDLNDLMANPTVVLQNAAIIDEETVHITYKRHDDYIRPSLNQSVIHNAKVTALARVYLDEQFRKCLNSSSQSKVLYCDTDSLIIELPETLKPEDIFYMHSVVLGGFKNEISEPWFLDSYTSIGPKNYAYTERNKETDECKSNVKVRGVSVKTIKDQINEIVMDRLITELQMFYKHQEENKKEKLMKNKITEQLQLKQFRFKIDGKELTIKSYPYLKNYSIKTLENKRFYCPSRCDRFLWEYGTVFK